MNASAPRLLPWSAIALNLLPLAGVLFLGWNLFEVMLVYWFEAAMMLITGMARVLWLSERPLRNAVSMLLFSPVYLGPAAAAVVGYGLVVVAMFYGPAPLERWEQFPRVAELRNLLVRDWLWVPMAGLLVNYAGDFLRQWVLNGAYRRTSLVAVMMSLYGRVILLQAVTVSAAAVVVKTGQPVLALALLVVVKIVMDVAIHAWQSRAGADGRPPAAL